MSEVRDQGSDAAQPSWAVQLKATVDAFNESNPVGTPVHVWPGPRPDGSAMDSKTRSEAFVLGGHTPAVFVEGKTGCIALTHVRPMEASS